MGQTVKEEASPLGSGLTLGPFCTGVEVSDLAQCSRIPLGGQFSDSPPQWYRFRRATVAQRGDVTFPVSHKSLKPMNELPGRRVWVPKRCQEPYSQCVATGRTNSLDWSVLGRRV